jgi:hypothetical protein
VSRIDETANSREPATDAANGAGCSRTYVTTNDMPRRNNPRPVVGCSVTCGVSTTVLMDPL